MKRNAGRAFNQIKVQFSRVSMYVFSSCISVIAKAVNQCNQSTNIVISCMVQRKFPLIIQAKGGLHVNTEKRGNCFCWSMRIHCEHVQRIHVITMVDYSSYVSSIVVEVFIDLSCCNGRVVTKFLEWRVVHMMNQPFVHLTITLKSVYDEKNIISLVGNILR